MKQRIEEAYNDFLAGINSLKASLKSGLEDIGKTYTIFHNLLSDLLNLISIKESEKDTLEKEVKNLAEEVSKKKEYIAKLIKDGNEEINKQRDNFETIKKAEIQRLDEKNRLADEREKKTQEGLSVLSQKQNEYKNDIVELSKREEAAKEKLEKALIAERKSQEICENAKLYLRTAENFNQQAGEDLKKAEDTKKYIDDKSTFISNAAKEADRERELARIELEEATKARKEEIILRQKNEEREAKLNKLEEDLKSLEKQLADRRKNLDAYKEEIDYQNAVARSGLEKEKRELVTGKGKSK